MATPRVVVVDYGIGNVFSVCQAIRQAGGDAILSGDHREIEQADRLVLPGVGAFGRAVEELRTRGLDEPIRRFTESGRLFLGICVGMQVMLERSSEMGDNVGLGLIRGPVVRIPAASTGGSRLRVPSIGWLELQRAEGVGVRRWDTSVLGETRPGRTAMYFLHSYAAQPTDVRDVLAEVEYGGHRIAAAVERGNLIGVQFHPERSGSAGQRVLRRFMAS